MTIYNWAEIPDEVKWVATDSDGWAWQYISEPKKGFCFWGSAASRKGCLKPSQNPFKGDWRESLEARPEGV